MKQRVRALLLAGTMMVSLLPVAAVAVDAATANYSGGNVTWIGTQAEYQKTLDNMFVDGMRKMKAGDKWGILDAAGEWVAPPIYDKIELNYLVARDSLGNVEVDVGEPLEVLFLDGYTQCVRDGKMGLMNQYGEEAIPAQYDAVGLPSEGICRIIQKSGDTSYLGYWSLELGRELVAPNQYVVSGSGATAAGRQMTRQMVDSDSTMTGVGGSHAGNAGSATIDYQEVRLPSGNRLAAEQDFMGGYAFVTTGKWEGSSPYGTILDSSGKEILPGGPYLFRSGRYPQYGPYMVFVQRSETDYITSDGTNLGKPLLSGVVGPEGVIIPAQYTGGIRTPAMGWTVADARMTVIPELKLVMTAKDVMPGKADGGRVGVVNFENQTVVPFTYDLNYFTYNAEHKIFAGLNRGDIFSMYTAAGKPLNSSNYAEIGRDNNYSMVNGFAEINKYIETTVDGKYHAYTTKGFVNLKTGAEFFPDMVIASHFSAQGTAWVMNAAKKWGLIDSTGKIILPYQYDAVDTGEKWIRAENGFAIVNIGQKQGVISTSGAQLVPCEYEKLSDKVAGEYVEATKDGKVGLMSIPSGNFVIPASYQGFGGYAEGADEREYFTLGVTVVKTGENTYCLVDKNGNAIPGSEYQKIYKAYHGLFEAPKSGYIGAEGKVVFPDTLFYSGRNSRVLEDTTLVVRDGKVGYISTEKLAKTTTPKKAAPQKVTAAPSAMDLLVDGKSVSVEAYAINGNNYIKVRDMAYFINGTGKNFGVTWNSAKGAVELKSNTPYATVAGDMSKGDGAAKPASRSSNPIYMDGVERKLTAYTIGGNNFFKLRDVMRAVDVYVGYENGIVTVDTSKGYELTDAEQAGFIPASAEKEAPPAAQVNKLEVLKSPKLEFYLTGNHTFTTAGFELRHWDENGVPHTITDVSQMTFTVDGVVITEGYVFKTSSSKVGTVGYKGLTAPLRFPVYEGKTETEIDKTEGQTDQGLAEGNYTMSILGKSIGLSNGWMVIDSQKPVTFGVEKEGDDYYLFVNAVTAKNYIGVYVMNGQLISSAKQKWIITHLGGNTYSIRQYDKPEMLVNASGQQSKDGTKVIVYKHKSTPKNAVITFTPVQ